MPDHVTTEHTSFNVENFGPIQVSREVDLFDALASANKDDRLIKRLRSKHPLYLRHRLLWQRLGDVALERLHTRSDKMRYLVKGNSEINRFYDKRLQLAEFLPETPGIVGDFVGTIFSQTIKRNILKTKLDPLSEGRLTIFFDRAGVGQETLTDLSEDAAELALTFGSVDAFLDHANATNNRPEGTSVPYVTLYTPEDRWDWEFDDDGHYKWVKYYTTYTERGDWDGEIVKVEEYRIITAPTTGKEGEVLPGNIRTYRVKKAKGQPPVVSAKDTPYSFPSIPIRTLYWKRDMDGMGEPWVKALVAGDLRVFRQESDLDFSLFNNANPLLKAWLHREDTDKEPLTDIDYGGAAAAHLDPGNEERGREDLGFLETLTADEQLLHNIITDTRKMIRRLSSTGTDAEQTSGSVSGVALSFLQSERAKHFTRLRNSIQDWEYQLSELVLQEAKPGIEVAGTFEIIYPARFEQRTTEHLDRDLQIARELPSATLRVEVYKEMAMRLLGEGASADIKQRINTELDEKLKSEEKKDDNRDKDEEDDGTSSHTERKINAGRRDDDK